MHLTNPTWIHHAGGAVYSIDFHPCGTKIATCGQGSEGGSGLVVIWNVKPIINEKKAQDSSCPRMLSRMLHQACVNCVRWSPDGSLLACGGDDHALTIWEFGGRINSAGTIGSKDSINVEKYREKYRLYGHTMDILHLEWSKDARFLASCGMDNTVVIWDALSFPNKITVLDKSRGGHDASVKGLSWDPIGKFIATQAADKTLRIWRTDNWRCIKVIGEPFLESSPTAMFCRMDWSPDGAYLVAPCAMNNAGPTAQLIRRKDWDTSLDLVGHRKATTVVRACPRLINYKNYKDVRFQVSCFAVGSRDKTLSVWLIPRVDRPLIVLHKLFKHSILDFSWHDCHLIICSMDGSVKSILFDEKEVGRLLSSIEMGEVCEKIYSTLPSQYNRPGALGSSSILNKTNGTAFVDDYTKLLEKRELEKRRDLDEAKRKEEIMQSATGGAKAVLTPALPQQDTVSAVNVNIEPEKPAPADEPEKEMLGKRPISPTLVNEPEKPNLIVESGKPALVNGVADSARSCAAQSEGRTKTGRRRINPIFVASIVSTEPEAATAAEEPMDQSTSQNASVAMEPRLSASVAAEPEGVDFARQKSLVIEPTEVEEDEPISKHIKHLPLLSEKPQLRLVPVSKSVRAAVSEGSALSLSMPVQKRQLVARVRTKMGEIDFVHAMNEFEVAGAKCSVLRGSAGNLEKWKLQLEPVVALLAANRLWTVAACFDQSVMVLSTVFGNAVYKPCVDSVPSSLALSENYLSICSQRGFIYVWNLEKQECVLYRQNLADIFREGDKLLSHRLTDTGIPMLSLSSSKAYAFSCRAGCWHAVTESFIVRNAYPAAATSQPLTSESLLSELSETKYMSSAGVDSREKTLRLQALLEERLCAARMLEISGEYRLCLNTYVQHLVKTGSVEKVRQLVSSLCNEEQICRKLKREDLLGDIYLIIRSAPEFSDIGQDLSHFVRQCGSFSAL